MKTNWKLELPQVLVVAAMFLWAALAWHATPERVPIHWNAAGEVDGYGGRFAGLLLLPLVAAGLYLLLRYIPLLDPGRANYAGFAGPYAVLRASMLAVFAAIYVATQLVAQGVHVQMGRVLPVILGAMFVALGAVMGKVRPNWFVGMRTPWTLSSKLAWVKTHRLAGWLFVGTGLLVIGAGLSLPPAWAVYALVGGALGSSVLSVVYSYFVWKRDPDKIPPAGTLPADP